MVASFTVAVSGSHSIFLTDNLMGFEKEHSIRLTSNVAKDLHVRPREVRDLLHAGHISKDDFLGTLCMMLVNTAYEAVKSKNDHSPEFEFFRHVRNASSHLNKFTFWPDEPRREARWRGIDIPSTLKGDANPFCGRFCFGEVLAMSDAVYLLWDINQKFKV